MPARESRASRPRRTAVALFVLGAALVLGACGLDNDDLVFTGVVQARPDQSFETHDGHDRWGVLVEAEDGRTFVGSDDVVVFFNTEHFDCTDRIPTDLEEGDRLRIELRNNDYDTADPPHAGSDDVECL